MISSVEAEPVLRMFIKRRAAIDANDVGLRREAVADVSHIADVDHRAVDGLDGQVVQFRDERRSRVGFNGVFVIADLHGAGGNDEILGVDGVDDVGRSESLWPASRADRDRPAIWRCLPPYG